LYLQSRRGGRAGLTVLGRLMPSAYLLRLPIDRGLRRTGFGQLRPLARDLVRTFERRLDRVNGPSMDDHVRQIIGLSRHWDGLVSTSAMWLIADDGGIEQPNGSILHQ
jgi:hypothetical protein